MFEDGGDGMITIQICANLLMSFKCSKQAFNLTVYKEDEHALSLTGEFWSFRPKLNLEHISQNLQAYGDPQKQEFLRYFLKEVGVKCLCCYNT